MTPTRATARRSVTVTYDVYGQLLLGSYDDIRARMDAYLATAA
jgi:hypothetical protein